MEGEETVKWVHPQVPHLAPQRCSLVVTETAIIESDNSDVNIALHTDNYPKALKLPFDT